MRKYIDDLKVITPNDYNEGITTEKHEEYAKQRETYGFDERETWNIRRSFSLWLYERLLVYKEVTNPVINLAYHKFDYKGQTVNLEECVDRMIEGLRLDITLEKYDDQREVEEIKAKIEDWLPIFNMTIRYLWW